MVKRSLENILAAAPDASTNGYILVPAPADLRRSLDMTQEAFAAFLRVPIGTVRNWEQGRTPPDPAARALLALVAADPAHAIAVLGKPTSSPPEGRSRARRFA
jgi:putative transcriptional regulator